jgi:hypothetical protein
MVLPIPKHTEPIPKHTKTIPNHTEKCIKMHKMHKNKSIYVNHLVYLNTFLFFKLL